MEKNYAFEIPDVPAKSDYLEVRYSVSKLQYKMVYGTMVEETSSALVHGRTHVLFKKYSNFMIEIFYILKSNRLKFKVIKRCKYCSVHMFAD